jgi:hypothetical protein
VPFGLIQIKNTPPQCHPALTSAHELILVVTMPAIVETFKSVLDKMTYATDFKVINLLHVANANLILDDLNTRIDEQENLWNIFLVSYNTLTSRTKS